MYFTPITFLRDVSFNLHISNFFIKLLIKFEYMMTAEHPTIDTQSPESRVQPQKDVGNDRQKLFLLTRKMNVF